MFNDAVLCRSRSLPRCLGQAVCTWLGSLGVLLGLLANSIHAENIPTFEQHVRPILKARCFHCHGEEEEIKGGLDLRLVRLIRSTGDSGGALVPGDVGASLLWQRIEEDEMPEGTKKLTIQEKDTIRRWIEGGAPTVRPEPQHPEAGRFTPEELDYWAFQPVRQPRPPKVTDVSHRLASADLAPSDLRSTDLDSNHKFAGHMPKGAVLAARFSSRPGNPIDAFVLSRLEQRGLSWSPPADRRTLLRRLSLDLTGLPPTKEEIENLEQDESNDVWGPVIDRLLLSPQYGVRWGRHWLDVAGYAESDGNLSGDRERPFAWIYRDYVIDAFNQDKPYDLFVVEQLAGDELWLEELAANPTQSTDARRQTLLAATGFLRMAPDTTETDDSIIERNQAVAEMLKVVGTGLLGLTVGCAQCHNHRYDPISIEDYYRFRAVFDPAFPLQTWKKPSQRLVDMTDTQTQAERDRIEKQAVEIESGIRDRRRAHCKTIQDREIAKAPTELQTSLRTAIETPPDAQTSEQKKLLDLYPTVRTIDWIVGQLVEYDMPTYRKFEAEEAKVAELRATMPIQRLVMTVCEPTGPPPTSSVFFRGDPLQPKQSVTPGEIDILRHSLSPVQELSESIGTETITNSASQTSSSATSGRRLAYVRQLVNGTHPLVARVLVNRVWMHHFGRGLVATPGDFGVAGEEPTHPELLDWLADDFVRHGWSIKRLHRQILLSTTYQQSSQRTIEQEAVDPENRLLGRMNLRRLEAEVIRDGILQASGLINLQLGGPSVPVDESPEGKVVIGKRNIRDGLRAGLQASGSQAYRRSSFVSAKRALPLNDLETFDFPTMNPSCQQRMISNAASQALWFLNDDFATEATLRMANQLIQSYPLPNEATPSETDTNAASKLVVAQITQPNLLRDLYLRIYGCELADQDLVECQRYVQQQVELLSQQQDESWRGRVQKDPMLVHQHALASLCQMLVASNRFLYVE